MKIFCVIPAFNEEKNIKSVIEQVAPLVDKLVVVDDGSTDKTCLLVEIVESGKNEVVLLKHIINRGQGAALRTGTEYCLNNGADIIAHFDADGQFCAQDIEKVAAPIKNGRAQVVFGSRFIQAARNAEMPFLKKYFIMPLARAVNRILFGVNLADPQSGFRAMSADAARQIKWHQDRMAHCSEIMFEVKKNNFKVEEVPIRVAYRGFGQNFFGGLGILKDLFMAMLIS